MAADANYHLESTVMKNRSLPGWLRHPLGALVGTGLVLAAAVLGSLLVVSGCSDLPTQVAGEAPGASNGPGGQIATSPWGSSDGTDWTTSQSISARGGLMKLDKGLEIKFNPGSLDKDTTITGHMRLNAPKGQATRLDCEFLPSMTFAVPAELRLDKDYLAGAGATYTLWYWNPATSAWDKVGEQPIGTESNVTFQLDHFWQYAVSR